MAMRGTTSSSALLSLLAVAIISTTVIDPASARNTPSPNDPIPKPDCDSSLDTSIRYSSSSATLYVESGDGSARGGCSTLGEIWASQGGQGPLYAVDATSGNVSQIETGTWLLTEKLYVEDGITLQVLYDNSRYRYLQHWCAVVPKRDGGCTLNSDQLYFVTQVARSTASSTYA